jgi:polysaccharide biosynthesis protein PslJ
LSAGGLTASDVRSLKGEGREREGAIVVSWSGALALLLIVIFFIPIRRYTLPFHAGFELEPYRLLVGLLMLGWLAALLVDRRVVLRKSGAGTPLMLITFAVLVSIAANSGTIDQLGIAQDVIKSVTFLLSFLLLFLLIVSVIRTQSEVDRLLKVMVVCGSIVALTALYEWRTGTNVFNNLRAVFPFLQLNTVPNTSVDLTGFTRGDRLRVYASAEHPIALGAALVMLVPIAVYLARKRGERRWWLAMSLLLLGAFATVSRTVVVMLIAMLVVSVILRPRQTVRLWPLVIPILAAIQVALPHTLGILKSSFASSSAPQIFKAPPAKVTGRSARVGPALAKVAKDPFFGVGFGTQIVTGPKANTTQLDDQWLGTLVETGAFGVIAWALLFLTFLRRAGLEAWRDRSDRGSLLAAITASVTAFVVSMFVYDALAFIQVSLILFVLLALGAVALRQRLPATSG